VREQGREGVGEIGTSEGDVVSDTAAEERHVARPAAHLSSRHVITCHHVLSSPVITCHHVLLSPVIMCRASSAAAEEGHVARPAAHLSRLFPMSEVPLQRQSAGLGLQKCSTEFLGAG